MSTVGWMELKHDTPESAISRDFFTKGQIIESKLSSINVNQNPGKAFTNLIQHKTDFDGLIQQVLRNIQAVYEDIDQYENVSEIMYKRLELVLKYYRRKRIDEIIEENKGVHTGGQHGTSGMEAHNIELLRTNMLGMLRTIRDSIQKSNKELREKNLEELDKQLVYLALIVKNLDSSIKYYGIAYEEEQEGEIMEVVEDTANADEDEEAEEVLEEFTEDMQDVENAMEEVEDELENL